MKFECQKGCTKCCRGEGFVFLSLPDAKRLGEHLGLPLTDFAEIGEFTNARWQNTVHNRLYLKKDIAGQCRFLNDQGCSVYDARPTQCRTYPFHADANLSLCPGVGKGREYTASEMLELVAEDTADFNLRFRIE